MCIRDSSIPADPEVRNVSYTVVDDIIYYRENSRMTPLECSDTAENRIKGMIAIRDSVRSPVSYTHLDVYKRQVLCVRADGKLRRHCQKGRKRILPHGYSAVSYTHLDVYKRQGNLCDYERGKAESA